jgi:tetratricopeptide (TPR) repeat protein
METTWKEQKHNSRYLLERAPDYILFSTSVKPSAPAERALLLYPQFINSYRSVGWFFGRPGSQTEGVVQAAFKKVRDIEGVPRPVYPVEYVQYYKTGLDYVGRGDHLRAVAYYDSALQLSPRPYYPNLLYHKAYSLIAAKQRRPAIRLLNEVLELDSLVYEAHHSCYLYALLSADTAREAVHERWLKKLVPWYWPKMRDDAHRIAFTYQVPDPQSYRLTD